MNDLYHAFHTMEHYFFSILSFTQVDYGNIVAYATGVQASGLNPAIVTRVDSEFSKNLTACQSFYVDKNIPWALVLPRRFTSEVQ